MRLSKGKNSKFVYYLRSYLHCYCPRPILRLRKGILLKDIEQRSDWEYIQERVNYYCKDFSADRHFHEKSTVLGDEKVRSPKVYYLDSLKYARYFSPGNRWNLCHGDVNYIPEIPSITKSRPICDNNGNAVLLKLDHVRHFVFLNDRIKWSDKKDMVIFRGAIGQARGNSFKENRYRFMQMYYGHPMCDLGEIMEGGKYVNQAWASPKLSLYDHLEYKFIMALEGNDVASNLKWIMSSNSIAVMPRPKYETWFMEAKLIPDYHYIEIKDDFSNLEEKLRYYIEHPDKASQIIDNAHKYVLQFQDSRQEARISLLVLDKYFSQCALQAKEN